MEQRRRSPFLGGTAATGPPLGLALHSETNGYLQRVDIAALQRIASKSGLRIMLAVQPGAMIVPSRPLCYVLPDTGRAGPIDAVLLRKAFIIGLRRQFDDDPRFGLVVLAEIACRALSPAMNDPGTAIGILGSLHRLFAEWPAQPESAAPEYDRIEVPMLTVEDMFDDVFPAIARDGAGMIEVAMRVQRVLGELARSSSGQIRIVAQRHAALAMARAERTLDFPPDLEQLRRRHADYWDSTALKEAAISS